MSTSSETIKKEKTFVMKRLCYQGVFSRKEFAEAFGLSGRVATQRLGFLVGKNETKGPKLKGLATEDQLEKGQKDARFLHLDEKWCLADDFTELENLNFLDRDSLSARQIFKDLFEKLSGGSLSGIYTGVDVFDYSLHLDRPNPRMIPLTRTGTKIVSGTGVVPPLPDINLNPLLHALILQRPISAKYTGLRAGFGIDDIPWRSIIPASLTFEYGQFYVNAFSCDDIADHANRIAENPKEASRITPPEAKTFSLCRFVETLTLKDTDKPCQDSNMTVKALSEHTNSIRYARMALPVYEFQFHPDVAEPLAKALRIELGLDHKNTKRMTKVEKFFVEQRFNLSSESANHNELVASVGKGENIKNPVIAIRMVGG